MMKARILSLFLALTLLTGSASPALAAGGYSDVPRDHWAAQSVRRAGELTGEEIAAIHREMGKEIQLETFVHGR